MRNLGGVAVCGAIAVAGLLALGDASTAFDVAGLALAFAWIAWLARRRRADADRRRRHGAVVGLCGALAAELTAGIPANTALMRACRDWPEFAPGARAAELGGDIPEALRSLAATPGTEGMRAIAAAWAATAQSGASLARVLDRLVDALRDEVAAQAEVDAALEPPRATARLLAALPVFGVALGTAMGASPVHFLVGTVAGRLCLLTGLLLALAGVAWVERLASVVGRQ
jgi:tight adherence protein B